MKSDSVSTAFGNATQIEQFFFVIVTLDKFEVTGQNPGRVFNSRLGPACKCYAVACVTKRPNLKLKTRPEQLLRSLLLAFTLPRGVRHLTKEKVKVVFTEFSTLS